MHTRLLGVLRTIDKVIPTDATPEQAWQMVRPNSLPFIRGSFWYVLSFSLRFARTPQRQLKVAEWIWAEKQRAEKAGRPFPPKPINVKPASVPQPHI